MTSQGDALKVATGGAFTPGGLADGEIASASSAHPGFLPGPFPYEWRHYQSITLEFDISASYTRDNDGHTETYDLDMSGSKTWTRQASADELQGVTIPDDEFAIHREFYDLQPDEPFSISRLASAKGTILDTDAGSSTTVVWTGADSSSSTNPESTSLGPCQLRVSRTSIPNWTTSATLSISPSGLFPSALLAALSNPPKEVSADAPSPGGHIFPASGTFGPAAGWEAGTSSFSITITLSP